MCNELPGSLICSFVNEHSPASVIKNRCECVCLIRRDSSCWTVKAVKVCRVHPVTSHIDTSGRVCVLCVVSEHLGCVSVCVCMCSVGQSLSAPFHVLVTLEPNLSPDQQRLSHYITAITVHHRHLTHKTLTHTRLLIIMAEVPENCSWVDDKYWEALNFF